VEVEVVGLVPPRGLVGTLTNGGISYYRAPKSRFDKTPILKPRVQSSETLILSDYNLRQDAYIVSPDQRQTRIFQGAGLASTWRLDLPMDQNDLDFSSLTDVRLTFSYKARFDPELGAAVRRDLASRPGINARLRGLALRWTYPDEYAQFQSSGNLDLELRPADFRRNETSPVITNLGLVVAANGRSPEGWLATLVPPNGAQASGPLAADGSVNFGAGSPAAGSPAVGVYRISLSKPDGSSLLENGRMPVVNLGLTIGYTFTPRSS
jgi:hypothetical protein